MGRDMYGDGVAIGVYIPSIPKFLGNFEYANVSVPVAVLI